MTDNPFFAPSRLPYGLPPFAEIRVEHYRPALEAGMAGQLAEIARITANPEPATFENTVVALERTGELLRRVLAVFEVKTAADTDAVLQELDAEFKPRLAAHRDAVHLDRALFARIDAVHAERAGLELDAESLRLLERHHSRFVRDGAQLPEADQQRLRELNAELAAATAAFGQNLYAANAQGALVLERAEELAGLSEAAIEAAADNGRARGYEGRYVLSLLNFTEQPALAQLTDREVRRRLLAASVDRALATNGPVAARMAALRAERAALFGHPSHAAYVVEDETAGSVAAVTELLERLVPPAVANAERELERLRAAAEADGVTDFGPHDLAYYAERVRLAEYDLDSAALRPYYELERVLHDGVFHAAGLVYGLSFTERPELVGYHPDTRVFEVFEQDGTPLGLFLADFFARPSKRGGAWMDELVLQNGLFDHRPVVYNNLNITKPAPGSPALLNADEVRTVFHEFGHALHGLFSAVRYPLLAGTQVPRDFVEFPSQVNEMWANWPEVRANYARHHETGEPLPAELVDRLAEAQQFGEGYRTVSYLAATLLDWAWHTLPAGELVEDAGAFEAAALERAGLALPAVPPRYRTAYFSHLFTNGYSAGYYAYIWSEVLDADTVEWFRGNGRPVRESGELFRRELLARGNTVPALAAFRAVVGREPDAAPLLARRGLAG
ncbi:M3 family metallopeptidase [Kitasatospora sp. NBC_01250]|uniref:M3 family metallopeptidase n=1 Tax=unclassified Kitasatospora TaxID=2633591 RepID=UPI002E167211|nr:MULTISPECIES: M3 family metallopeptidase [unclassified Kitasatospora]WSJ67247.1 M3 family metallopeptidase [Kitasatospora sp. NBC_01302]